MIYTQTISAASPARMPAVVQDTSDETLVAQIAGRDKRALQQLYSRHHVRIYRFALRFLNDEAAAEDTVSEVFIDVWRQAERFEGRSQVTTWLLAIARNKALSMLRRRSNEEVAMLKSQRASVLQDCLTQLSPAHREIVDLVYYHEKSVEEVAEIISVPANTVKTRMFYARKRIGELMAAKGINRAQI
jgi:RNA polymerase sigma-70 factor, ECF subfamily